MISAIPGSRLGALGRARYRAIASAFGGARAGLLSTAPDKSPLSEARDVEEADVVIVGAGPAGLSAAIRIKQISAEKEQDVRVIVVEKASEIGGHTLSGAVMEPGPLAELFPSWEVLGAPLKQAVVRDQFKILTRSGSVPVPVMGVMRNRGNYIVSLSNVVKWLGEQAEELGVEVFPGTAASEVLYDASGRVTGVATGDIGIGRNGRPTAEFARGLELKGKVTLLGEGCHGSLSKQVISRFGLRKEGVSQTYGLGVKEVWEVDSNVYAAGTVLHTVGFPLRKDTYGGGFVYHMADNMVSLGLVVGLDYKNPHLSPFQEFQRFKTHPAIRPLLEGGRPIAYGARTLVEGGWMALPQLHFPGGALLGDAAGMVNIAKIKGSHNAIRSGMLAAETVCAQLQTNADAPDMQGYQNSFDSSPIATELRKVRNIRQAFTGPMALYKGLAWSAADMFAFRGHAPITLKPHGTDHSATLPASKCTPIEYPKPDNVVTFDLASSVSLSGTNHRSNQPVHLQCSNHSVHAEKTLPTFGPLEQRFCPAGVYEYVDSPTTPGKKEFVINAQNCVHCKTCDIKDPEQDINWTVPEGGGGPQYTST